MNDAQSVREQDPVALRAAALDGMLKAERWTRRKVALAIGSNPTYVNARMNGQVDLTFSDIEAIAPLLKMSAPQLVAVLQDAEKAPTPKGEGLSLPEMDSNHQPADVQPGHHLATVTQLPSRALEATERGEIATIHYLKSAS